MEDKKTRIGTLIVTTLVVGVVSIMLGLEWISAQQGKSPMSFSTGLSWSLISWNILQLIDMWRTDFKIQRLKRELRLMQSPSVANAIYQMNSPN